MEKKRQKGRKQGRWEEGEVWQPTIHTESLALISCSPLTQLLTISLYSSVCISAFPKYTSPPSPANSCVARTRYPLRGRKGLSRSSDSIVCCVVGRREGREGGGGSKREGVGGGEEGRGAREERRDILNPTFNKACAASVKQCSYLDRGFQ